MAKFLSSPELITWECTSECNLNCIHCSNSSGKASPHELDTRSVFHFIDEISKMKVLRLGIDGGEPLLRKDIFQILKHASEKNIFTNISTNGTLVNKQVSNNLAEVNLKFVQVSLDGSNAAIHDKIRGTRGTWDKVVRCIDLIHDCNIPLMVTTVLMNSNKKDIENIAALAYKHHVETYRILDLVPSGRAGKDLLLPINEKKMIDLNIRTMRREYEGAINIVTPTSKFECYITGKEDPKQTFLSLIGPKDKFFCEAGTILCTVKPEGNVVPCTYFPDFVMGNVREESFESIWNNGTKWDLFRNPAEAAYKCRGCRFFKMCMGGCRAQSYVLYGQLDRPDPRCWYNGDESEISCY